MNLSLPIKKDQYDITLEERLHDEYEKEREKRNRAKMKANFEELMRRGAEYTRRENYHDAAASYYFAKTIYPRNELPRRFLSESYMKLCAEYGEYCREAKKEVYYGFRYVKDTSIYYSDMLDMASALDLYPHLDKHENDVMRMIYKEQTLRKL